MEEATEKIAELTDRIRELEECLEEAHKQSVLKDHEIEVLKHRISNMQRKLNFKTSYL